MKNITIIAFGLLLVFMASCMQEQLTEESQSSATDEAALSISNFIDSSNAAFDLEQQGIYKGFISNLNGSTRGTYVLNAGNDGHFWAIATFSNGKQVTLYLASDASKDFGSLKLSNDQDFLIFDLTSIENPKLLSAQIGDHKLAGSVHKQRGGAGMNLTTGVFDSEENPFLTGTWNLITLDGVTRGDIPPPPELTDISELIIIHNGNVYSDDSMELLDAASLCIFPARPAPYITGLGLDQIQLISNNQTSMFGSGTAQWEIVFYFDGDGFNYFDQLCNPTGSGTFQFTALGGAVSNGTILIDESPI